MKTLTRYLLIGLAVTGLSCSPGAKKARHLERAEKFFAAGNYDSAEIEYITVLRVEAENPVALHRLGVMNYEDGRLSRAIAYLTKCQEVQPDNLDARVKFGQIQLATGQRDAAREAAEFVLAKQPANAEALGLLVETAEIAAARQHLASVPESAPVQVALGLLAIRQADFKTAEAAFQKAVALDPQSSAGLGALATLYWAQNDLAKADHNFKAAAEFAPVRSGRQRRYAEFKIQTGDVAAGQAILAEIVKQAPDYLPAWVSLAEVALTEKKYDECAGFIGKILARDAGYYEALLLRGRLSVAKGELTKAATEFEGLVAAFPQSTSAHYQLALVYLANNDPAKAITSLNQTLVVDPEFTDATLTLAMLKLRSGDLNGAIALLEPMVQAQPSLLKAQQPLADAYRAKGDFDAALKLYRQLADAAPQNARPHLHIGAVLLQQNKRPEARAAFDRALVITPGYFPAVEQLVLMDFGDKQYAAAKDRVVQLIQHDPQQPDAHFLLGKIAMAQRDTKLAEAELLQAIELRPDFIGAYVVLANLYIESNQHLLALEKLQTAAAKNPQDIQPWLLTGMIYSKDKNYPAARDAYEKVLAINPKFHPALNDLAYLYAVRLGEIDRAHELARRARDLAPNDPRTADTLGWVLCLKGQYPAALSLLEESAVKLPNEPDVHFHLAVAQYRSGQEVPARLSFEQALQLKKPFDGQAEANRCLAVLAINVKTATAAERALLDKQLVEHPEDPVVLDRLAGLSERDGAPDKAVEIYQTALRANPNNGRALLGLARIYSGRPAEAAKAFELAKAAYKLAPDDATVAWVLGRLAYQAGDYKWALSLLQGAARKLTGDAELLFDLAEAHYSMGFVPAAAANARQALAGSGAFTRSESATQFLEMLALAKAPDAGRVQQVLAKMPDYVPALAVFAIICEQQADPRQAAATYEKILSRYPDFSPAKRSLAILYAAEPSDNPRAFEIALKAREAYPDDAAVTRALGVITYNSAMAQYRSKQFDQCKPALRRAMELNLPEDLTVEAKRVLAELQ